MVDVTEGVILPEEFLQKFLPSIEWLGSEILVSKAQQVEHVVDDRSFLCSSVDEPLKAGKSRLVQGDSPSRVACIFSSARA